MLPFCVFTDNHCKEQEEEFIFQIQTLYNIFPIYKKYILKIGVECAPVMLLLCKKEIGGCWLPASLAPDSVSDLQWRG